MFCDLISLWLAYISCKWFQLSWIYTDVLKLNRQRNDLALKSSTVNLVWEEPHFSSVRHCSWKRFRRPIHHLCLETFMSYLTGGVSRQETICTDSGIWGESVTTKARNGPIPDEHCCHLMCRRRGTSINYRLHLTSTEMNWTSDVTTIVSDYWRLNAWDWYFRIVYYHQKLDYPSLQKDERPPVVATGHESTGKNVNNFYMNPCEYTADLVCNSYIHSLAWKFVNTSGYLRHGLIWTWCKNLW